jgi:hypothetical protein
MGEKYNEEFHDLRIRCIVQTDSMDETENEKAIKHNMGAYLINMYLVNLLDYNIPGTQLMPDDVKEFIQEHAETTNSEKDEHKDE